jgi:hypothetical protein
MWLCMQRMMNMTAGRRTEILEQVSPSSPLISEAVLRLRIPEPNSNVAALSSTSPSQIIDLCLIAVCTTHFVSPTTCNDWVDCVHFMPGTEA